MGEGNESGGPSAVTGYRFQDAVTAIVYAHTLAGTDVEWLSQVADRRPVEVRTETGGPGDDISVAAADGSVVEIQVRKRLTANERFWSAVDSLSEGLHSRRCLYGTLVVCPSSSGTVRDGYARAVTRIGDGALDRPSKYQKEMVTFLREHGRDPEFICKRLRIETVAAVEGQEADVRLAKRQLGCVCSERAQVEAAWRILRGVALASMGRRGRRTVELLVQDLASARIGIRADADGTPASVVKALLDWTMVTTETFSVSGTRIRLPTDRAWLPLRAKVLADGLVDGESAEEAVRAYQETGAEPDYRPSEAVDANAIGFFRMRCVVVGGPGSGKSLLLKVLAREFSKVGLVSVRVALDAVARRVHGGSTVEEAVMSVGLGSTGVTPTRFEASGYNDSVFLCDGLDDCGPYATRVAEGLAGMATSRPSSRFIVTTRRIGYPTSELSAWRHYELLSLKSGRVVENVAKVVELISDEGMEGDELRQEVEAFLGRGRNRKVASMSPLLLTLVATLFPEREELDGTRTGVYVRIFRRIERADETRLAEFEEDDSVVQRSVLNCLGWILGPGAVLGSDEIAGRCADMVARTLDESLMTAKRMTMRAIRYWMATGLIEKVQHGSQEFILFVHRTFGEYTAARLLLDVSPQQTRSLLGEAIAKPEFDEVLGFALETRTAGPFARVVVERAADGAANGRLVNRVCTVLGQKDSAVSDDERRELLDELFSLAKDVNRDVVYMVGRGLATAAMGDVPHVRKLAEGLVAEDSGAAKLVGWTVLARHFALGLDCVELMHAIESLGEFVEETPKRTGSRALTGGAADVMDVYRIFLVAAMRILLREADRDRQDELVSTVTSSDSVMTFGFAEDLSTVLRDVGRDDLTSDLPRLRGVGKEFKRMIEGVFDVDWATVDSRYRFVIAEVVLKAFCDGPESCEDSMAFPNLGAFFELSGFWETPAPDTAVWDRGEELSQVHELMRAVAYILELPVDRMAVEAARMLSIVQADETTGHLGNIPHVDPEERDWELARSAPIKERDISTLRKHPSTWVRSLACEISRLRERAA